jgi:hypothetical protein
MHRNICKFIISDEQHANTELTGRVGEFLSQAGDLFQEFDLFSHIQGHLTPEFHVFAGCGMDKPENFSMEHLTGKEDLLLSP